MGNILLALVLPHLNLRLNRSILNALLGLILAVSHGSKKKDSVYQNSTGTQVEDTGVQQTESNLLIMAVIQPGPCMPSILTTFNRISRDKSDLSDSHVA
jgi:hypothetical protein